MMLFNNIIIIAKCDVVGKGNMTFFYQERENNLYSL